jgi:hypothetical protein
MKYNIYLFSFFLIVSCNENFEKQFKNYQELKNSNYYKKGWIPSIIPLDAYDIKEVHNIDTNNTYGIFRYQNPESFSKIIKELSSFKLSNIEKDVKKINRPPKPSWWCLINKTQFKTGKWNDFKFIIDKEHKIVYYFR